jgi:hypothetical protein
MVNTPVCKGDDHAAAAARAPGPGRAGRVGTPLPDHARGRDPHSLPDRLAQRAGPYPAPDRPAGAAQPRHHPPGAQALPGRRRGRGAAPAPPGPAAPLPAGLGAGIGPGGRVGPPRGWGGQCAVDVSAAGRLPGRGDRAPGGDRDGPPGAAPRRVCVQAAPLGAHAQGAGAAGVGKNG